LIDNNSSISNHQSGTTIMKKKLIAPLIKGYLPVRLKIPESHGNDSDDNHQDETFLYIKEHSVSTTNSSEASEKESPGCTLFVSNVPVIPGIQTKLLLQSIFGRYGDVHRVTVVDRPRQQVHAAIEKEGAVHPTVPLTSLSSSLSSSLPHVTDLSSFYPSFLAPAHAQGRYAHVVFTSAVEMKRTLTRLSQVMISSTNTTSKDDIDDEEEHNSLPGIVLDRLEVQTLMDETDQWNKTRSKKGNRKNISNDSDDDDNEQLSEELKKSSIARIAHRYRTSVTKVAISRDELLERCNAIMARFEDAEERERRAREMASSSNEPDEDGFVTVRNASVTTSMAMVHEEQGALSSNERRKGSKRNRKKKKGLGASELPDFYRFQTKESRKRSLQDLRVKFEEDLAKIKRLKEDHMYQPFSS
jgi:ribosomal RNA-processing protein 7